MFQNIPGNWELLPERRRSPMSSLAFGVEDVSGELLSDDLIEGEERKKEE